MLLPTVNGSTVRKGSDASPDVAKQKLRMSPSDLLRLLSYTRPYRVRLAIALVSLLIAGALGLSFPQVVRMIIDAAFVERDTAKLNRLALLLVAVFAAQAAFSFLRTYLLSYTGERIVADVRTQLYNHLIGLPVAFFANQRVGELTSRLASDVSVVQTATNGSVTELLRLSLMLVGGVVIIFITNTRLSLLMLAIVPVVIVAAHFYGRYVRRLSTRVQDRLAEANSVLEETLSAIRIVQSFVREEYERARYRDRIQDSLRLAVKRAVANGGFIAFIILVVYSGIAVVLWFGSRMVVAGQMTAGDLIAFVLYTFFVGGAVGGMTELYGQFNQAIGATRRVFELLDTRAEIEDPQNPEPLTLVSGRVQLIDVHFTYPGERALPVLTGVNIEARPGEIIALVGPSGAGKSTLAALIPRFYDVSSGAILIDGHDIRSVRLIELRSAIGVVPQETTLFGGTVRENIAYGRLGATGDEVEAVARAAHAHEFITEFPDGYDTVVGDRGVKLSGGQRQRVAIARALLKNPAILILDEATSSLDSESERLVQEALETLMLGRTTFVIAHRLSTVRRADRIVALDEGRIVEEGTHDELLANGGLYKRLYEIQFRDYRLTGAVASEAEW
ncbi:MAG TPA: ABC transporter transmembrane domain-containing protein [Blastocatellia bacterium]|nr:ABC transporter transmembrane domain-containing protein [Blastocatellia bacterium]